MVPPPCSDRTTAPETLLTAYAVPMLVGLTVLLFPCDQFFKGNLEGMRIDPIVRLAMAIGTDGRYMKDVVGSIVRQPQNMVNF